MAGKYETKHEQNASNLIMIVGRENSSRSPTVLPTGRGSLYETCTKTAQDACEGEGQRDGEEGGWPERKQQAKGCLWQGTRAVGARGASFARRENKKKRNYS